MNRKLESEYENLTTHIDEILKADDMNSNISLEEIESAMKHAKLGKAVGIDNLPNEVLRNTSLLSVLQKLFNVCFPNGIVPSMWCSSIIHPILKDGKDYRDPMETIDYADSANELVTASSRALGALTSKYYQIDGLDYETFTKLFSSMVTPVMDYSSGVWGYKIYDKLETLQNRAIRTFLGVGKSAPNPAICGDMGWTNSLYS
ncbi:unnamed protein product [Mytilus edulis]|uniref:Uncharacterized protein n=1 Tax=Mytilus edulis TaxID=6550 RepID=A0A8S3PZ25_MYTED|nr:unnamed protein product [Mytilus edulis]